MLLSSHFSIHTLPQPHQHITAMQVHWTAAAVALALITLLPILCQGIKYTPSNKTFAARFAARKSSAGGVLLWAHGRSATHTLGNTFSTVAHMPFCNGIKEGFYGIDKHRDRGNLSFHALQRCISRGELFSHVKPSHLQQEHSAFRGLGPSSFFKAAWAAGFRTVIATFRANQLAREVSSYEQSVEREHRNGQLQNRTFWDKISERWSKQLRGRGAAAMEAANAPNKASGALEAQQRSRLPALFAEEREEYTNGLEAAKANGFAVVELSFDQVTMDLCRSIDHTLDQMATLKGATRYTHGTNTNAECEIAVSNSKHHHTHLARSNLNKKARVLAKRINHSKTDPNGGLRAALDVAEALRGTSYEWMLNLSATAAPPAPPQHALSRN